jgi:hypothetical protein
VCVCVCVCVFVCLCVCVCVYDCVRVVLVSVRVQACVRACFVLPTDLFQEYYFEEVQLVDVTLYGRHGTVDVALGEARFKLGKLMVCLLHDTVQDMVHLYLSAINCSATFLHVCDCICGTI